MIDGSAGDEEILRFLANVKDESAVDAALAARLATVLADSGDRFVPDTALTADVASTGGPASLSTLLCPLLLRVAGCSVIKLGVPGRPAGGIDCLAQLPGYRTELSPNELTSVVRTAGFAHFLASGRYAPLDARVFRLRQQHGLQDVPTLVAASLLSKKLAVGIRYLGLDVRVGRHGNFGRTMETGAVNAEMLVDAADLLGISAGPVVTDGTHPYQPYIGRKEALAALWLLFESKACAWLAHHLELCRTIASACVPAALRASISEVGVSPARDAFYAHLEAQGSSPEEFERVSGQTLESHVEVISAPRDGFVRYSVKEIRHALVEAQRSVPASANPYPDPVGLVLLRRPGEWVRRGESIATLRIDRGLNENAAARCRAVNVVDDFPAGPGFEAVNTNG